MSAVNKLQTLAESWQIQMLTERSQLFQTLLFLGKLLVQYGAVREELLAPEKDPRPANSITPHWSKRIKHRDPRTSSVTPL